MITLIRPDGGRQFTVEVGTVVRVELEEQGGTGYLWLLDALDQRFFELLRVESKAAGPAGMTGIQVVRVWELTVRQKGKSGLSFSYCRPWERKEAALDHFVVQIAIE